MKARAGTGWQYVMTDLSLILFMITAAALREAPVMEAATAARVPAEGEPVALWRAGDGSPPLAVWLAETGRDPRLRLTIYAAPDAMDAARALTLEARRPARIVLDPDHRGAAFAALTFDRGMARPLQPDEATPSDTETSP